MLFRSPAVMGLRDPALEGVFPSAWQPAQEGQPWWGLFLVPGRAKGQHMGRERLQWWLHSLCVTQQWRLTSMAFWVSSISIPSCGFPPYHPLRLSPHSQQQSPHHRFALQSPPSSSQPLCAPADTCPSLGYAGLWHGPSV